MCKRLLILAGGGGHTGYACALAQALHDKARLSFLAPEEDMLSVKRLRRFGEIKFLVKPRGPTTPIYDFVPRLAKGFVESISRVSREFDVVVSTGSNFCIPPALVAWVKGRTIINIESSVRFSRASKTAKILQPFSAVTALQWEEQRRILDGVVVGPLLAEPEIKPWKGGYILVTGGTYGHKLLFDTMAESKIRDIVLQTGRISPEQYVKRHPEWSVITVTDRFNELIAGSEVVVTHFGMTVLEAIVYRKPVVLVPNPLWTRTAGMEDAKYLARKVNAVLLSEISLEKLLEAIAEAKERKVPVLPDGAKKLAEIIIKL